MTKIKKIKLWTKFLNFTICLLNEQNFNVC